MNLKIDEIVYWVDEEGHGVQRHDRNTSDLEQFDFSELIPEGESFIFDIK